MTTEWQSIETAPKDGTWVLFYTPACEELGYLAFQAVGHIDRHGLFGSYQWEDDLEPSHWMPLPDPPKETL